MRYLLIHLIKLYWRIIPEKNRNICLFSESCSRYVKRTIEENGVVRGISAFVFRIKHCRGGYHLEKYSSCISLFTVGGYKIHENDINPHIIQQSKDIEKIREMSSKIQVNTG